LGKFAKQERDQIDAVLTDAASAAVDWANQGIVFAMNRYNADPSSKQTSNDQANKNTPSRASGDTKNQTKTERD
jgi:hypothetical protein